MRIILGGIVLIFFVVCLTAESENVGEEKSVSERENVSNDSKSAIMIDNCPVYNFVPLTSTELFNRLVNPCRYDKIQRPETFDENGNQMPLAVYVRLYIFFMENLDTHNLQFTLQVRLQVRYQDHRLMFSHVSSNDSEPIVGEEELKHKLWKPHLVFINEKSSGILGSQGRDVITSIRPDGTVLISSRLQVSLYCSMDFRKFPFDQQKCKSVIGVWIRNSSNLKLHWEDEAPLAMGAVKILSEYTIVDTEIEEVEIDASSPGLQYGDFVGNYSALTFSIILDRSIGYYLLDYYFPSILIVAISWVTFWLQADQTAPRAMLGTSSMLSFITLSASQTKTLAKVSYIKLSEIWFIVCALFIFGSLVEFAFVNLLWRRKKQVELEKVTTTNILRKILTPDTHRKEYSEDQQRMRKASSELSINGDTPADDRLQLRKFSTSLTPENNLARISSTSDESMDNTHPNQSVVGVVLKVPSRTEQLHTGDHCWTVTLTHQEIAIMLDTRARLAFPCAFLVFNIFYWILVNL